MIPLWVAFLGVVALGGAVLIAVELRLKAMRELFGMAIIQRESFDSALRDRDTRISQVQERIEILHRLHGEHVDRHVELDKRVKALEGKRLSPP